MEEPGVSKQNVVNIHVYDYVFGIGPILGNFGCNALIVSDNNYTRIVVFDKISGNIFEIQIVVAQYNINFLSNMYLHMWSDSPLFIPCETP